MPKRPTLDSRAAEEIFRSRLIAARKAAGLTQTELAERLGEYQSFVSKIETGERKLSAVELLIVLTEMNVEPAMFVQELAQALGIKPDMRKQQ